MLDITQGKGIFLSSILISYASYPLTVHEFRFISSEFIKGFPLWVNFLYIMIDHK